MARILAADVRLRPRTRGGLVLLVLRRASLALSLAFTCAVPLLWSLADRAVDGAGRAPLPSPPVLGAPWGVRLFGLEVLDPLAALGVLAHAPSFRVALSVVVAALPVVALTVVLGRYFCGWLCPYALVVVASNAARSVLARLGVRTLDVKLPRATAFFVLGALVVATVVGGTQLAALVYPPSIVARAAWKLAAFGSAGTGVLVVAGLFLFDTFVSRAGFCRSLCPGGAVFRALSFASPVRVRRDPASCTSCTLCDVVCNMGQGPMTDAVDGGCDRCARCVAACPTGALDLVAIARPPRRVSR